MNIVTKSKWSLAISVCVIVLTVAAAPAVGRGRGESRGDSDHQTVFTIGTENNLRDQFRDSGFTGMQEYECDATNCAVDQFPMRIYKASLAKMYDDDGVAQIKLDFQLSREYDNAALRLARWGVETDLVTVDNRPAVAVTAAMLGSGEDIHGQYDLNIGPLSKGRHTIGIRVAEDNGVGSGRHSWDAISLTVW